jgi:vesicle-fusing ATPase
LIKYFLFFRQIGKMLNPREPKIVNGPQILDKYVAESEAIIQKLFAEADEMRSFPSYLLRH